MQLGFSIPIQNDEQEPHFNHYLGHGSPQWSNWDGGKIGGRPSWLNPRDIPREILRCRGPCGGTPLCFVTQLYCPADDVGESAFHRSLYVFACPKCCSSNSSLIDSTKNASDDNSAESKTCNLSECIKVLRCQLPKKNDFYPIKGDTSDSKWIKHTSSYWAQQSNDQLNLCAVCGQRSKGKCPKQDKWFCCPDHQKEYLRATKKATNANHISLKHLPSVCYDSELVVEEEPQPSQSVTNNKDLQQKAKSSLFQSAEITDADATLEQSDLNALTGNSALATAATGVTDPTSLAFYARMAMGGEENDVRDQCLRYSRWPEMQGLDGEEQEDDGENEGPLWLSSDNRPPTQLEQMDKPTFPPSCQYCGAPRSFEFQILPQMLHYLFLDPEYSSDESDAKASHVLTESESAILLEARSKIDSGVDLPPGFREEHEKAVAKAREALLGVSIGKKNGSDGAKDTLEWGTIAIYTCTQSCGEGDVVTVEDVKDPCQSNEEKERLVSLGAYREEAAWMQPPLD